jgi:tetratricopeptide (TPR) repeat protein
MKAVRDRNLIKIRQARHAALLMVLLYCLASPCLAQSTDQHNTPPSLTFAQHVPFAARLFYEEAQALFRAKQPEAGRGKLRQALDYFPTYFNALFLLATESHKLNDEKTALEMLERARKVNDSDARVYRLFGLIMTKQGKFRLAEFAFREALQRDPNHPPSHQARGVALLELALLEKEVVPRATLLQEAERALQKALALSENKLTTAHLHLADVYKARGEKRQAVRELETYLKHRPNAPNEREIRETITRLSQ